MCGGKERATLISVEDLDRAKEIPTSWYGEVRDWTMYVRACFGKPRQYTYLHRWIMQPNAESEVDHRDHDGLNNTRDNLRETTPEENFRNRRDRSSGATDYRDYEASCTGYVEPEPLNYDLLF
jgi:hypothetical protein